MKGVVQVSWVGFLALALALGCGDKAVDDVDRRDVGHDVGNDLSDDVDVEPAIALASVYDLTGSQLFPESGAFDSQTRTFYVGSLGFGTLTSIDGEDGSERLFFAGTGEANRLTLGVQADVARRRLWVCSITSEEGEPGLVWAFDLDSGERTHEFVLADTVEGASCNDVDVDGQGRAYVTDRKNPRIYRVDASANSGAGTVEIWAQDPLLEPQVIGLNGIAISPDGASLLVGKYLPARLLRIAMHDPSDVALVELAGDTFAGTGVSGADGIAFLGEALYVAFPEKVVRVVAHDDQWRKAQVDAQTGFAQLAALIVAEDALYAVKGAAVEFVLKRAPALPFQLIRVDLEGF
ncbi:MAG: SMP-30/gluconolactonase/LRE family protein [Bradymonadaceae bacterium]|nr:SMP-30/gluconolactonase/LRE family protein [Lujinxingiaceae bacterium]